MNLFGFVVRSFGFYWRRNLGLFLTAVVSAAVLAGALLVGDSVRYSLARIVDLRLGRTEMAIVGGDRFFGVGLADRVSEKLHRDVSPVLQLGGIVSNSDGSERLNRVQVVGVDGRFFDVGAAVDPFEGSAEGIVVNELVAGRLGVVAGDEVVLRIGKPGQMSRDVGLMPDSDLSVVYRGVVLAVVGDDGFGRFGLAGNQTSPLNIFVPLKWLGEKIDKVGLCNLLLAEGLTGVGRHVYHLRSLDGMNSSLKESMSLEDYGLELGAVTGKDLVEFKSRRVFIGDYLSEVLMAAHGAKGCLTYFVNGIRSGEKVTPYSIVSGVDGFGTGDDEIVVNEWLAEDIGAKVGDSVELSYYVVGVMRKLEVRKSSFTVKAIVPVMGELGDRELMPDFPGLSDAENCRDWDPGMPVDLERIRDKDEVYWDDYGGTPKGFVSLAAGQKMWGNRFGGLTSVRYSKIDSDWESTHKLRLKVPPGGEEVVAEVLGKIDPGRVGFSFANVRAAGEKGAGSATDFGQLFLGLSMFLIAAAMILTSLVFGFSVDNRSSEIGMLKAVGFTGATVRRMFMLEASGVALAGCVVGGALGVVYTKAMIFGLSTIWAGAISGTTIHYHGEFSTICIGAVCGFCVSLFSVWLSLRRHLRKEARELLSMGGEDISSFVKGRGKRSLWVSAVSFVGAVVIILWFSGDGSSGAAGAFFSAGGLLLIGGVSLVSGLLKGASVSGGGALGSLWQLAWKNASRRGARSLAVVSLIAAGSFLVVSIGVFKHDPLAHANERGSGTGGFALFAESSIAVVGDLNDSKGRKKIGLDDDKFADVRIVQMRVRDGDDASCLNLNRAQKPQVIGVDPFKFEARGAFGKLKVMKDSGGTNVWELLDRPGDDGIVNAVADNATAVWALGKKLGESVDFVDSDGAAFKIRIVGIMGNSVLQGSLIISEANFVERFALEDGYRMFLVDAAADVSAGVAEKLSATLVDYGFDVSTTAERLGRFSEVENTYLSIFQLLGGLSLVLASVGLGLVVLVNVLDRRGELAMLRAVGFGRKRLRNVIIVEHLGLLALGLVCGVFSAIIAVLPAVLTPGRQFGAGVVVFIVALLAVFGILFVWISAWFALRGELIHSLRKE